MNPDKRKWVYANSQNNAAKVYTIIGTLLGALGVVASIANDMPVWQIATIAVLTGVVVIVLIGMWIPSIYFSIWLISKRRMLNGFNLNDENKIKIDLVEIKKTNDFHQGEDQAYKNKDSVLFTYTMDFNMDVRFLAVDFSFKNKNGVILKFKSNTIDLVKKKNNLLLSFDYSNRSQVEDDITDENFIPLITGTCEMKFNLKNKQLEKITFNKDTDTVTLGIIKK